MMNYSKIIIDFLESHPAISVNRIESDLSIPRSTLHLKRAKERGIPAHHVYPVICYLAEYGLKIDGYDLTYDRNINAISARKSICDDGVYEDGGYRTKEGRWLAGSYHDLPGIGYPVK